MLLRVSAGVLGVIVVAGLGLVLVDRRAAVVPAPTRVTTAGGPAADGDAKARARNMLRASRAVFERNTGQHPAADAFVARGPGYLMSLRPNEARVALQTRKQPVPAREESALNHAAPPRAGVQSTEVRLTLVGANASASGRLEGPREARANYFLGPDPARWRTDVQQFDGVRFDDVYPGIDLVYYGRETTIEYDLVVRPGASPASIELAFSGAREVRLAHDGALVLTTALGELRQPAPVLYQERDGRREPVGGRFVLRGDNHVAFDVDDYDRSAPLVIDPVLQYSTYFGGSGYDIAYEIEVDAAGAMYIAGETVGTLPVNGFDTTPNGSWDLFVSKFNSAGALVYSTYYGSTADDSPSDLALDSSGSVYVVGYTGGDVPTTAGALQTVRNGADIFVFKLTSTGLGLSYATYLGSGPNFDNPTSLAVDSLGAAYIGGSAGSADFPTTVGAWDRSFSGGNEGFIAKLNPAGSQLQFSTYLGGSSTESVQGIAVHALGTIYVTGTTNSCDFPTTAGAADTTCNDGSDVFVTALLPLGGGLVWSTYFGGSAADYTNRIAVAPTGEVVVVGGTSSSNLPAALNTIRCCDDDGFIARIASGGGRFVFSRYIGGYGSDNVLGLALDGAGAALITGWTEDNDAGFPITIGAFRPDKDSGVDAFITKVTPQGWVDYSTYVGGTQSDGGTDIAVGRDGAVYLTGWTDTGTDSTAFPVTFDALFSFGSGNFDAFLMRFDAPIDRSLQIGSSFPVPIPVVGSADSSAWLEDDGATYFGIIEEVSVSVYVTHTFDADLSLSLIGPDGTTVLLTQALGGSGDNYGTGCGQEYQRTTFSDTAATAINASNAPFVGAFRPLQLLSAFAGRSGAGEWRLRAIDSLQLDSGAIQCWTAHIRFRSPTVTSISPTSGSANGGTTVTITGSNFAADGDIQPVVRIGGIPVTRTGWSPTSFTGVTSARYSGLSDVVVTDALGRSGVLRNGFTYAGTQTLTVNGAGFGSGTVTTPAGFAPAINCTITGGVASGTCAQNYTYGVNVTLNATPTGGGTFTGWSGACSGASCTVAMTASRSVTATFTPPGQQLTVTGGGSGSGVVTSQAGLSPAINCTITSGVASGACSASYAFNTSVTLTATPAGGGTFTSWSGACSGSGTCPLVMSQARAVMANFTAPPQTLTVSGGGTGSGVVTSQLGLSPAINCTITNGVTSGACSQSYPFNTSVTLTATPSGGGTFTSWSGACSGSGTCPLVMSQSRTATATFTAPQTLTVSGGGTGSGAVTSQAGLSPAINCTITNGVASGACAQTYPFNTTITLTATPTGAGSFSGWGGACTGAAGCTVVMSQARGVTAAFSVAPLTLTIVGAGTGGGGVASQAGLSPAISCSIVGSSTAGLCSVAYPLNTVVTLTATPGVGSFAGWSGPCSGLGSCTVTMSQARVVTATFEAPRTLTITGAGTGSGAITSQAGLSPAISCAITGGVAGGACSQSYPFNTSVTLTAAPAAGSTFTGWGGACSAATGPCTLLLSQARTAVATFTGAPSPSMTIETMTPASGSTAGGTLVTLRGNGLSGGTVTVGGRPATSRRQIDARTMTFLTPSGNPGVASMTLAGPSGSITRSFTYQPPQDGSIPGARNARFDYDGRYLVFESDVALVADDTNGVADIYVMDRRVPTAPPVRLSVTSQQLQAIGGASVTPAISSTGRLVAFASRATNLVPSDTNGVLDVFVHDRDADGDGVYDEPGAVATTRVSVGPGGGQADGPSTAPTLSGSGRWVGFVSMARNLGVGVSGDLQPDVFVRDRALGTTVAVSDGAGASGAPVISLDGRFLAFESLSATLVSGDTNGVLDVFLHDRDVDADGVFDEAGARATSRVSVPSGGTGQAMGGPSRHPSITQEGRWTVFESEATNLIASDSNGLSDVFIHDRVLHTTVRLSRTPEGEEDTAPAVSPSIAANGSVVHYVRGAAGRGAAADAARDGVGAADAGSVFGDDIEAPDPTNPDPPPPLPPDPVGSPTAEPCVSGNGQADCGETPPDSPGSEPETKHEGPPPPAPEATVPVIFDWSSRRGYWDEPATIDIAGQGFGPTSQVFVDGQAVATELRGQSLRIHLPALSPPAILAPVDRPFEVRNGSLASNTAVFSYDPSPGAGQPPARSNPVVDALTVSSGPTAGNTALAVQGAGFEAATVIVDGVGITPNAAQSTATRLVFTTPPHAAGPVAVAVRNGDGVTAAHTPAFAYVLAAVTQAPVVSGVNPNSALGAGHTALTIAGQHFAPGATVTVAGVPATQVVVVSNTQIQALAPPRPSSVPIGAAVDLTVTVAGQSSTLTAGLSYAEFDPTIASPDDDGDGLPRNWEGFFGLSDANATDAVADADGDGRTNVQEFADGTHPLGLYTRYFAEGATGPYFSTRISLANPNASPAIVQLRVLTDSGLSLPKFLVVPALSKRSIRVADEVPGAASVAFASVIESDVEIVVDRSMFWSAENFGSTAETSVPAPSLTWYLAEGATHGNFFLFYLLQNPSLTTAADVRIRYLKPSGAPVERLYTVAPRSRLTIQVDEIPGLEATDVSGAIESLNNVPVIAERAMYSLDPANPGLGFVAGHESAGVTAPATSWFLAEGATGPFFDLFVLLANPNPQPAEVRLTYLLESGVNIVKTHTVPGNSRRTIYVGSEDPRLASASVATRADSINGVPIVVERAMWWPSGQVWQEAHNSAGSTTTGVKWGLAEGESGAPPVNTRTYILIANTSSTTATVRVTLLFQGTRAPIEKTFTVLPNSRKTIDVLSEYPTSGGFDYGAVIESLTGEQIVVERAMYSDALGVTWAAGTNALGTRLR